MIKIFFLGDRLETTSRRINSERLPPAIDIRQQTATPESLMRCRPFNLRLGPVTHTHSAKHGVGAASRTVRPTTHSATEAGRFIKYQLPTFTLLRDPQSLSECGPKYTNRCRWALLISRKRFFVLAYKLRSTYLFIKSIEDDIQHDHDFKISLDYCKRVVDLKLFNDFYI